MKYLFLATLGVAAAVTAEGQSTVKVGSIVNLQNQYSERQTFLDTRGRVSDKREFAGVDENVFVSTHPSASRDKGSGSWKVVSAKGKKDGANLMYGDEIHLSNMYPGTGYLDVWSAKLPIFEAGKGTDYPVFASRVNRRDGGSGTWIIGKPGKPEDRSEVKANETIVLESLRFPKHYLEVNGALGAKTLPFKDHVGNVFLVFVTDAEGFHSGSERWRLTLQQ